MKTYTIEEIKTILDERIWYNNIEIKELEGDNNVVSLFSLQRERNNKRIIELLEKIREINAIKLYFGIKDESNNKKQIS